MSNLTAKMRSLMEEVNGLVAEREDAVQALALAVLTGSNLFLLGSPGQAKTDVINLFRQRITGTEQFYCSMSKKSGREELFGWTDLASMIPGCVAKDIRRRDELYQSLQGQLEQAVEACRQSPGDRTLRDQLEGHTKALAQYREALSELYGSTPRVDSSHKLPTCHLAVIDEIFKTNEALLNSLLEILNDRTYTNEGITEQTPLISVFAASNELPNFGAGEDKELEALFDRLTLRVKTEYIRSRENRLAIQRQKQLRSRRPVPAAVITLEELAAMREEVLQVEIPEEVNFAMDDLLMALREKQVPVSDRTYFRFTPFLRAQAWLEGRSKAILEDLRVLRFTLWQTVEQIPLVESILEGFCVNQLQEELRELRRRGTEAYQRFQTAAAGEPRPLAHVVTLREELLSLTERLTELRETADGTDLAQISGVLEDLDHYSREAAQQAGLNTSAPLEELLQLEKARKSVA